MSEKLDEILNFGLKMRKYKVNNCCIVIAYVCRKEPKKKKVSSENPKQGVSSPKSQHMPFWITSRHRKNNWQQLFKNKTQLRVPEHRGDRSTSWYHRGKGRLHENEKGKRRSYTSTAVPSPALHHAGGWPLSLWFLQWKWKLRKQVAP